MAPWDEPFPKTYRIKRTLLQMEKKKSTDEATEHLMNIIKGSPQEYIEEKFGEAPLTEEKSLADEEILEEHIYEEISKKISMKFLMLKT
jgi:hypothetical protein